MLLSINYEKLVLCLCSARPFMPSIVKCGICDLHGCVCERLTSFLMLYRCMCYIHSNQCHLRIFIVILLALFHPNFIYGWVTLRNWSISHVPCQNTSQCNSAIEKLTIWHAHYISLLAREKTIVVFLSTWARSIY